MYSGKGEGEKKKLKKEKQQDFFQRKRFSKGEGRFRIKFQAWVEEKTATNKKKNA